MGNIRLSFLPFSFEPKALAEPAPTLVPWPKKKKKFLNGAFFLWMVAIVAISQN
jgi:hypothetical protein